MKSLIEALFTNLVQVSCSVTGKSIHLQGFIFQYTQSQLILSGYTLLNQNADQGVARGIGRAEVRRAN